MPVAEAQSPTNTALTSLGLASAKHSLSLSNTEMVMLRHWVLVSASDATTPAMAQAPLEQNLDSPAATASLVPTNARAQVLLVHGLGGCGLGMSRLVPTLMQQGFYPIGLEQAEIGENPTMRGHITDGTLLVQRVVHVAQQLHRANPKIPLFLVGLSLGGLLSTLALPQLQPAVSGLVLLSPAFRAAPTAFPLSFVSKVVTQWTLEKLKLSQPTWWMLPYYNNRNWITRQLPVLDALLGKTPCVKYLNAHSFMALLKLTQWHLPQAIRQVACPVLLFVGAQDHICDPRAMTQVYHRIASSDKTLVKYPDAFHDLPFEPESEALIANLSHWIAERI
jgi:alpha-beta hydrolase superfamily lysophospholipase